MKPLQFVVAALLVPVSLSAQPAQSSLHPLDGMGTAEYWTVYDALQSAGHMTPETKFTSVLLHPPEKSVVLAWKTGQAVPREADVVLLRNGKSYTARVDVSAKRVVTFAELQGAHSAFLASEMFDGDAYIKQDQPIIEALRKHPQERPAHFALYEAATACASDAAFIISIKSVFDGIWTNCSLSSATHGFV